MAKFTPKTHFPMARLISKKKFVNFNQRDINLCYSESYKTYNENRLSIIIDTNRSCVHLATKSYS